MKTVTKGNRITDIIEIKGFVYSKRESKRQPFKETDMGENLQEEASKKTAVKHTPMKKVKEESLNQRVNTPTTFNTPARRSSIALRGKRASDAFHGMCRMLFLTI